MHEYLHRYFENLKKTRIFFIRNKAPGHTWAPSPSRGEGGGGGVREVLPLLLDSAMSTGEWRLSRSSLGRNSEFLRDQWRDKRRWPIKARNYGQPACQLNCDLLLLPSVRNLRVIYLLRTYRSFGVISVRDSAGVSAADRTWADLSVHRRYASNDGLVAVSDRRRLGSQSTQHVLLAPTSARLGSTL